MPKISICSPVWIDKDSPENKRQPRYEMFLRAMDSVFKQTNHNFEWIIADDMSNPAIDFTIETMKIDIPSWLDLYVKNVPEKKGRVAARNLAMESSHGDFLCWFDSDDELSSHYIDAMVNAIRVYPDYDVFNFNHLVNEYDYSTHVRNFINMEQQGDKPFGSGNIGSGAFIFSRKAYEKVGPLPELGLWDFAAEFLKRHPECKPFFESKEQPGKYHSLGNPWGDDYFYFYELTRHFKSKYLNIAPYHVHSRFGHKWPDDVEKEESPGSKPEYDPKNI